ncbi:MAG TPA: RsmB/NOP family class I SAM-dependent RNA methyltransferase [Sphingomicrobium sp.]|nr:RsmB/NOP family class I SAM-dependent RNA methyltransferase [Sphingomicrobium sp.]
MTPAARLQAAIEILDEVIASARDDGPPADAIVTRYFKSRRYAGSKDRRAVRDLVFRAIRRSAERPGSGRAAILGLAEREPEMLAHFGEPRGPERVGEGEQAASASLVPQWLIPSLSPLVAEAEWPALLERAPVDLRVNVARSNREELLADFPGAEPAPISPWGIRLAADSKVDDHPAFAAGLVEVQDEGSQLIAVACQARPDDGIVDLCAGAGGKALAIAAATGNAAEIIACDTNRSRLSKLPARAARAGATIGLRLLDAGREVEQLADLAGAADLVLVDAPCSGSGTWRRNPEGRWRLTAHRLDRLVAVQAHILDLAERLVKPGGRLVYAVCSLLSREGAGQIQAFLSRHSSWMVEEAPIGAGRPDGGGRMLTPAHDSTDGFFVASLIRK